MQPSREFFGWSEPDLLTALRDAQIALAAGTTITTAGSGDVNASSLANYSPRERIQSIQRALYELNNERYAIFAAAGQNRTRSVFNSSSIAY